jgi:nucleoside-diphosphate-sugar epimerase
VSAVRALVTGGAGFIGSHLAARLLAEGIDVRILDNFSTGRRANTTAFAGELEVVEGDVRSYAQVSRATAGCELVFHQAALPSVYRSVHEPLPGTATNVLGTLNVLLAAREHGVRRLICASSSSVYGANPTLPKREDVHPLPISPYATDKLAGEGYCRSFAEAYGLETVSLRYFNVFGPRQNPNSPYAAVVPRFVTALLEGRCPTVFGDGEQSRDFTFVDDAVEANVLAMRADAPASVYNVAAGQRTTINMLLAELSDLLGTEVEPHYLPPRPGEVLHTLADLGRARRELGYEPTVALREGLVRTIAFLLDQRSAGNGGPATATRSPSSATSASPSRTPSGVASSESSSSNGTSTNRLRVSSG